MMASQALDDASKWLIGHALDVALAIANHAMRSGQKHKLRTFFPCRLRLFFDRRHILAFAPVVDGDFRSFAERGAC
jgi:hypothetical protein